MWFKFASKVFWRYLQLQSLQVASWGFLNGNYTLSESENHFLAIFTDLWKARRPDYTERDNVLSISPSSSPSSHKQLLYLTTKKYIYISNTELLKEKSINARETLVWNYHSFPKLLSSLQTPKCFIFNLLLLSCFGYEVALLFSVLPWSTRRITVQPSDIWRRLLR